MLFRSTLLGFPCRIIPQDGLSLVLERLPTIAEAFPLTPALLRPNTLYLGHDLTTGQPLHLPLAELTHTLVVGPSGYGKSTLLHQIVLQLLAQPTYVAEVVLVDLKAGLELAPYRTAAPHVTLVESYADLPAAIRRLNATLDQRIAATKAAGRALFPGNPVIVVVDEFAQIMLELDTRDGRQALLDGFVRLGNQARAAGMFLWVQVQHAVAETLPTALRRNLTATIGFRQPSGQAAAQVFGDTGDFPVDITRLKRGQSLYRYGRTSEITALQAAHASADDLSRLNQNWS